MTQGAPIREMTLWEYLHEGNLSRYHYARRSYEEARDAYWDLPWWLRWLVSRWAGKRLAEAFWCGEPRDVHI